MLILCADSYWATSVLRHGTHVLGARSRPPYTPTIDADTTPHDWHKGRCTACGFSEKFYKKIVKAEFKGLTYLAPSVPLGGVRTCPGAAEQAQSRVLPLNVALWTDDMICPVCNETDDDCRTCDGEGVWDAGIVGQVKITGCFPRDQVWRDETMPEVSTPRLDRDGRRVVYLNGFGDRPMRLTNAFVSPDDYEQFDSEIYPGPSSAYALLVSDPLPYDKPQELPFTPKGQSGTWAESL